LPSPRPEPTALKLLKGNPGKRPVNKAEPKPELGLPDPPDHLDSVALEEWNASGPGLARMRVLTLSDKAIFAAYCEAWSLNRRTWQQLKRSIEAAGDALGGGLIYSNKRSGVTKTNPLVPLAQSSANDMLRFAAELGMTPAARARLEVAPGDDSEAKLKALLYVDKAKP
jgi:P27 family predicted phage terminase small subunit